MVVEKLDFANINAQELLEQILSTGKDKKIAAKGEDYLVDKLIIEDSEVSRAALRKGVGTGAAAGAIALLLSSLSSQKMATLGGLSALGALAFKAHKAGKMPTKADEVIGLLKGPKANNRSEILIRAMISAAKVEGAIHDEEVNLNAKEIAAMADSDQAAAEIYAVSCRVANGINPKERDYLDSLAIGLKLIPEVAARIETDVRLNINGSADEIPTNFENVVGTAHNTESTIDPESTNISFLIMSRLIGLIGAEETAREWYQSTAIPSLGYKTAKQLVEKGLGKKVLSYLDRKTSGAFE